MVTFSDIKAAIPRLSISERSEIAQIIEELEDEAWDQQIQRDYDSGKLDKLLNQVREDIREGRIEEGP